MKLGIFAPLINPHAAPEVLMELGHAAEEIGLDSIWLGEHVVIFDEMKSRYPGSPDGKLPIPKGSGMLDPVGTLGFLAARTSSVRLGTGVTLLPQRSPVYTAKEFATLDWLSKGRIDLGIGVGWCREELEACGVTWAKRDARCDEYLEVLRALWVEDNTPFRGTFYDLPACRMDPKPVQAGRMIPIYVGGHSKTALRRAARLGRGWYGFALSPDMTAAHLAQLDTELTAAGRSRTDIEILITPPAAVTPDLIEHYRNLGVDRLLPIFLAVDAAGTRAEMRKLDPLVDLARG